MIHVVPVVVLQLLRRKIHARHFVVVVVGRVEAIAIIDIDGRIRMPRSVSRDFYFCTVERDFVEDSADGEQIFLRGLDRHWSDD